MPKSGEQRDRINSKLSQSSASTQRLSDPPQPDIVSNQQTPPPPVYSRVTPPSSQWRTHNSNRAVLIDNDKPMSSSLNAHSLSSFAVPSNFSANNYSPQSRHNGHVQYQPVYHNSSRSEPGGHLT